MRGGYPLALPLMSFSAHILRRGALPRSGFKACGAATLRKVEPVALRRQEWEREGRPIYGVNRHIKRVPRILFPPPKPYFLAKAACAAASLAIGTR